LAALGKEGGPISVGSLSEREHISPIFLEQIFFKLRKAGIVSSVRGPGGGFCFARPLDTLTLKEILDAAGEEMDVSHCDKNSPACERIGKCMSHRVWADLAEVVNGYFGNLTLASVLENKAPAKNRAALREGNVHG
jgi:Rrf2 family iron-sulfur cluster assembly transcriptional regulator